MKPSTLLIVCLFWVLSCNQVNNLDPVDPGSEPKEAVQVVKSRFPDASDLVFKAIMPGNVWEVGFTSAADKYISLVDKTRMFETFKSRPDTLPEPMTTVMPRSVFSGGTYAENAEDIDLYPTYDRRNRLLYRLNGVDYSYEFYRNRAAPYKPISVTLEFYRYHIPLKTIAEYPAAVRDYIKSKSEISFFWGEARVKLNYEKHYWFQVAFTRFGKDELGFLIVDEKGKLLWSSKEFNLPANYDPSSNIDTLPVPVQKYLDETPELSSFMARPQTIYKWKSDFDGVSGYYLKMQQSLSNTTEVCELYFDENGNLINRRTYLGF